MYKGRADDYLASRGLPTTDAYDLADSPHRFSDGAHYRIEVPTINNPAALRGLLEAVKGFGVHVNRISVTYGVMRYLDEEIREILSLAADSGIEVFMMVGPRASLDIGAQAHINTLNAQHVAYRLRGTDQLSYGIEDALRAIDLGCRGIIVCDEGLLYALSDMRSSGDIPATVQLKASVLLGVTNILSFRRIEQGGADSINVQRDMPITMLGGFRLASALPMDIHANNPGQTGGFVRTFDMPALVRIAAPLYVKTGNIAVPQHSIMVDEGAGFRMAREVAMTVRHIQKYFPEGIQSAAGETSMALPEAAVAVV